MLDNNKMITLGLMAIGSLFMGTAAQAQPGRPGPGVGPGGDRVECASRDYKYARCPVRWRDADLLRQTSSTQCMKGRNWGVDGRGLWVDRGCAGIFIEAGRHGGGFRPGPDWDRTIRFTCRSSDFRYAFCAVDTGGGGSVRIERQLSDSACIEGRTWGWNRAGVWVDRGCQASFVIDRRWR